MRIFSSELDNYQKLFIGDYDSYSIIKNKLSANDLLYTTKIAMLLFDYVLFPAAFFWQSDEMALVMDRLEQAIKYGYILPMIRNNNVTTDIYDYFQRRKDETHAKVNIEANKLPELASEIATDANLLNVNKLIKMNTFVHVDGISVRKVFQNNWKEDLFNYADINSLRMILSKNIPSYQQVNELCNILFTEESNIQFSRASCIELTFKIIPKGYILNQVQERISWLYLKSNAESIDSKFYYSMNPYKGMIREENLLLLISTLNVLGITPKLISSLSISEIILIKNSIEYCQFIKTYRELIGNVCSNELQFIKDIQNQIVFSMGKEKILKNLYSKVDFIQQCSASIFLGLMINYFSGSVINTTVLFASGGVAIVPTILKRIELINKSMLLRPFLDFKNYIVTEQYSQSISKRLEGKK